MAYTHYRNKLEAQGQRAGQAFVIQCPQWRDGGMVDAESDQIQFYMRTSGQQLLETAEGVVLYNKLLSSAQRSCLFLKAQPQRARRFLGIDQRRVAHADMPVFRRKKTKPARRAAISAPQIDQTVLVEKVQTALLRSISRLLKIEIEDLDKDIKLYEYGFDHADPVCQPTQ